MCILFFLWGGRRSVLPFERHLRHDRVLLEEVCRTIDNTSVPVLKMFGMQSCNARSEGRNGQINYERYITAAALYRRRIAYRWRIVSPLSRYASPFMNLSPFFVTLDPNESMPAPSRRNVLLRHHAHPCLPFNVGHLCMGLY